MFIAVGKSSSIFSMVKPSLLQFTEVIELDRERVLEFNFNSQDSARCCIVIFSGIVSNDRVALSKLEKFHTRLVPRLEALKQSKVILLSSSAVYGDYKKCFNENDFCLPVTNYGRSKLVIEEVYTSRLSQNLSVLRLGNFVGLDSLGKAFHQAEMRDRYLDCRSDFSTPLRTYVDDKLLIKTFCNLYDFKGKLPDILNVGRSKPQSMYEITKELGLECTMRKTKKTLNDIILDTSLLSKKIFNRSN